MNVLNVNDTVLDKVIYFLNNLPTNDVKIIKHETFTEETSNDFIASLVREPIHIDKNVAFLTREESHERKSFY